jgi:hypothetical protein
MTITDTRKASTTKALAASEAHAVLMVRNGKDLKLVEDETGLTRAQIAAAVARADANRHARTAPANMPAPKADPFAAPATTPKPTPPTPTRTASAAVPAAPVVQVKAVVNGADLDDIEDLLAWAEEHGPSRATTLAARVRVAVEELRGIARNFEEIAEAKRRVDELQAQLSAARESLRLASGSKAKASGAKAPSADKACSRQTREWAQANGHQVADRGSIPAAVLSAYAAAHQA